ncbi:bi-domain-containing oxidoreductase [bacterium]|nr:bi-domain-containing oxidoreductase [bacterium]
MKQIFSNSKGEIIVEEVSAPVCFDKGVLVANFYSLISTGTEVKSLEEKSQGLISRVIHQPELIKKGIKKIERSGLRQTLDLIKKKGLTQLGYSSAGKVIEVGKDVSGISVGDNVACAGAGYANHAEIVWISKNLIAKIPQGIDIKEATFTTLGAIGIQAVRRARVEFGETIVVIGLGLIGQLIQQILKAAGCKVIGIDLIKDRVDLAKRSGMDEGIVLDKNNSPEKVMRFTGGIGADAVIICAATSSDEPVKQAILMARRKGRIVVVGDVGMKIDRSPFYEKELDFMISCSYGPGRYDIKYEKEGIDYPIEYVRWTENRNMTLFLDMLKEEKIDIKSLISLEFPVEDANKAYETIGAEEKKLLGILLKYKGDAVTQKIERRLSINPQIKSKDVLNIGIIGAGKFVKSTHLPNLRHIDDFHICSIVTANGANAKLLAKKYGADYCTTDYKDVIFDKDIDVILIGTRHNLHAPIALDAIKQGKDIFVEKPMAMNQEEIEKLRKALQESPVHFTVGYNRRYSSLAIMAKELLGRKLGPMIINYRVNAGFVPRDSWIQDSVEGGGRIVGECCHFFDLFYYFINSEPLEISAYSITSNKEDVLAQDNFSAIIKYADGSIANLIYTSLGNEKFSKERIEIYKEKGILIIDDFKELGIFGFGKDKSVRLRHQDKGLYRELVEFAKRIKGGESFAINFEDGRRAMECSFKVQEILRCKK